MACGRAVSRYSTSPSFSPFLGLGYNAGSLAVESGSEDNFDVSSAFNGFGLRAGLTLGVAF